MNFKLYSVLTIVSTLLTISLSGTFTNTVLAGGGYYGENLYPWDVPGWVKIETFTWGYPNCLPGLVCGKTIQHNDKPHYYRDENGYDIKNCTSYAAWKAMSVFGKNDKLKLLGNATLWDDRLAERGFKIRQAGQIPEVGDLAQDEGNDNNSNAEPGHVGYVEDVFVDVNGKYYIVVSEYNKHANGEFSIYNYSQDTDGKFWRNADHEAKTKKWDTFIDVNGAAPPPVIARPTIPPVPTVKSIPRPSVPKVVLQSKPIVIQGSTIKIPVVKLQGTVKKQ